MRRTVFSLLFLVAAVLAVAATPATTGVASADAEPDCTAGGYLAGNPICEGQITYPSDPTDPLSLYQAALQTDGSTNQWFDLNNNLLEISEETAWQRAERAVVRAAANDSVKSVAQVEAKEAVRNYYTIHERNLADKWDLLTQGYSAYVADANNVSDYDMWSFDYAEIIDTSVDGYVEVDYIKLTGLGTYNYTLVNGSTAETNTLEFEIRARDNRAGYSASAYQTYNMNLTFADMLQARSYTSGWNHIQEWQVEPQNLQLNPPSNDYDTRNYLSFNRFATDRDEFTTQKNAIVANMSDFVNATYSDLRAGEINYSDYLSRTNQLFNYGQNLPGENATFSESTVALASLGYDPIGNNSAYIELTWTDEAGANRTDKGQLLSEDAPTGGFQTGTWYNATNFSGPQTLIDLDGNYHNIPDEFKIVAVYDSGGNTVENPDLTPDQNDYQVSNTTELQQKIQRLQEQINEFDDRLTDSGSGGSLSVDFGGLGGIGDFFGNLFGGARQILRIIVLLVLAALLLAIVTN